MLWVGFVVFGIIESSIAVAGRDNIVFFWFPPCAAAAFSCLFGVFKVLRPSWASMALVTIGALAGGLATVWTLVVPVLAVVVIVLVAGRGARPITGPT